MYSLYLLVYLRVKKTNEMVPCCKVSSEDDNFGNGGGQIRWPTLKSTKMSKFNYKSEG